MHRRALTVTVTLSVLMALGAGIVQASGKTDDHATKGHSADDASDSKHASESTHDGDKKSADKTFTLIGIQEPDEASFITPDGQVITGTEPFPEDFVPSPGDVQVYRERLFRVDTTDPDNPRPRGRQLGTVLAECTTITVGEEDAPEDTSVLCSRMFTLDRRGDIAAAEAFTFADPLSDTIPVTGGTGKYRDVGGEVSFDAQPIEGTELFNSIYTFKLLHLDDKHRRNR